MVIYYNVDETRKIPNCKVKTFRNDQVCRSKLLSYLYSTVNVSETPAVATVEKKEYVYETKEEAKQAFKELLREKVCYEIHVCPFFGIVFF